MTQPQPPAWPSGAPRLGSARRKHRCGYRLPRQQAGGVLLKALGWAALAVFVLVLLAGTYLLKHAVGYSGAVLGDLRVSQPWFSGARAPYRLKVGEKTVGWVSQLDSWYIERGYAYGTLVHEPIAAPPGNTSAPTHATSGEKNGVTTTPRAAAPADQMAYFLFDCRTNEFRRYASDRATFAAALAQHGLPWRNFMSGENIVGMKYNQRRFDSTCDRNAPR